MTNFGGSSSFVAGVINHKQLFVYESSQVCRPYFGDFLTENSKNGLLVGKMGGTVDYFIDAGFRSICEPLVMGDSLNGFLDRAVEYIRANITKFEEMGSGWQFQELNTANVETARYRPLV